MTHDLCKLTAENRDQLRNHTFGNCVRATFLMEISLCDCSGNDFGSSQVYVKRNVHGESCYAIGVNAVRPQLINLQIFKVA